METSRRIKSDLNYAKQLVGAGWEGVASARKDAPLFAPPLLNSAWLPMAAGAAVGIAGTRWAAKRKDASGLAVAALVGTIVGFGVAVAWASRGFTTSAARNASRRVSAARDQHWLEQNPIDYA